ncbi:helix-turn-helix transcriptional regulator [Escherichia coli]|uniref:helix-turn-helix transcriptional regulator n=1 Tax=Escherichia coli TaxID=562 RepID=UPI0010B62E27|nr:Uncharacterised protein [Escherichia coli]
MATRLGEKLRDLRKQRGLTLEKLADMAGLSKKLSMGTGKSRVSTSFGRKAHCPGRCTGSWD